MKPWSAAVKIQPRTTRSKLEGNATRNCKRYVDAISEEGGDGAIRRGG